MNVAANAHSQNKDDVASDDVCTCTKSHGARVSVLNLHANTTQMLT